MHKSPLLGDERRCPLIMCRYSHKVEVDGPLCPLLGDLFGKPVLPSGLLAPYDAAVRAAAADGDGEHDNEENAGLMRWLDAQPERSVLYVAFGSEAPLTPVHVRVLAQVPQVRVLAQPRWAPFMTHAGWSSLMDSFLFGHPLVMLSLFADQGLTARLMTERRVGLEVPWDSGSASFRGEDVTMTVRRVMMEEEGKELLRNAKGLQELLWDTAMQERYVDELLQHLLLQRRGKY